MSWRSFAAIVVLIGGLMNFLDGLVAISDSNYYKEVANVANIHLPATDKIATWGWVVMLWGVVMVVAGIALFGGAMWARILGIVATGLNALLQLAFLAHFPFWSFTMILIDMLALYAIVVHGGPEPVEAEYDWDDTTSAPRDDAIPRATTSR